MCCRRRPGLEQRVRRPSPFRSQYVGLDKQYLTTSMQGDMFEIQGGKLAEMKSTNPAVLTLAKTLVSDHSESLSDSEKLAKKLGIEIPKAPTESMQWELQIVGTLSGSGFNHWYSLLEVKDHIQDISETKGEVKDGSNAEVRKGAKSEIPMLRKHLKLAKAALKVSP